MVTKTLYSSKIKKSMDFPVRLEAKEWKWIPTKSYKIRIKQNT